MFQNGDLARALLSAQPYGTLVEPPFNIKQTSFRKCALYSRQGHWNQRQRLKYTIFLIFFQKLMQDDAKKKNVKIFDMMSDMIVTRNSKQCRNHHQKMEKYRKSIPEIIATVAQKYEPRVFTQICQRYSILIKTLLYNQEKYIRVATKGQQSLKTIKNCEQASFQVEQMPLREEEAMKTLINPEIKQEQNCSQLLKNSLRIKQDQIKTKAEYNDSHTQNEDFLCEDIPFMRLDDSRSEEESQSPLKIQRLSMTNVRDMDDPFQKNHNFKLDKNGMKICRSQVRKMNLQRQWHAMNVHHLSSQIIKEKESIKYCESAIKLLRMTIDIIDDDSI